MHSRFIPSIALAAAFVAGGSLTAVAADKKKATAEPTLVWPLPPDPPRIRFVTAYRAVDDFKKKKPGWKSMLLGADSQQRIEQLMKPYGIAVAKDGRVFVTDTAARRVFVFDPNARTVTFIGDNGPGKIAKPVGVAVDDNGMVFVADATLKRVFGYGADGHMAIAIGHDGELQNPSGLAIDRAARQLYVADAKKHQVLCYSSADGSFVRAIGKRGTEAGEFNFPTNLSVDRQGRLYVADTSFNNFQIFDADGNILLFVGNTGNGPGEFLLPAGLFVDDEDRIYVADQGNARVQVFQRVNPSEQPR